MHDNQSLDINRAFKFYFQDKEWIKKTLIGGLLVLSIVGNFAVTGWALHIQRREVDGQDPFVPGWEKLGEYFLLGLKYFLVVLVWNDLPPIIGPVFMLHQQPGAVKQLGETLPGMGPCNQAHCGV